MKYNRIPSFYINTAHCRTAMCEMGEQFNTDKSPLSTGQYRHAYTPIYSLLLAGLRHYEINIAEIGIEKGSGLQLFRSWFPKAHIFGFEKNQQHIAHCESLNLRNTKVLATDAGNPTQLQESFLSVNCKFDLIIDDGSHLMEHQLNTIQFTFPYLKSGGVMIIEDVFLDQQKAPEDSYLRAIQNLGEEVSFTSFIYPQDPAIFTGDWNNEKLLYLVKA